MIIAVFIIGTIEFWPVKVPVQNNDSPDYMDSANAVLYGAGMDFSAWLNQISRDPMNAYSETNIIAALELIDVQLEAIKNLHGYTDVPEEYSVFHDGMRSFCNDEEICLNNFKTLLYSDAKLPQKDIINYLALRGNNYLWLVEEYVDLAMLNAFDSLSELA